MEADENSSSDPSVVGERNDNETGQAEAAEGGEHVHESDAQETETAGTGLCQDTTENNDANDDDTQEEEQLVSSFQDDDSRSRDVHDLSLGDEEEQNRDQQPQQLEAVLESERNDNDENTQSAINDESNDSSNSKISTASNKRERTGSPSLDEPAQESPLLTTDEKLPDEDDEDGENLVAEVDISAMMEISFDEGSETNQSQNDCVPGRDGVEPEVIPIDSDDDGEAPNTPVVEQRIFRVDTDDNITEMDISNRQISTEGAFTNTIINNDSDSNPPSVASSTDTTSRRPRRAAAEAAAKTIHEISAAEKGIDSSVFAHRRKSQEDSEFNPTINNANDSPSAAGITSQLPVKYQKCHICKKNTACSIVVKHFGSELSLCSNSCFSRFRHQGSDGKSKTLPCSKCSLIDEKLSPNNSTVYFWETMNFCSDLCVGRYQMDVGSKCCTCGKNVPWSSLGKYCVRFGSDIRQFCNPQCLEGYKKNAKVCFNCQLDIRRIGNVVLANIPSKSTPKEFCSHDCVELYCDRNVHQPTRAKPQPEHFCFICHTLRVTHKELVLSSGSFKVCSEACWLEVLKSKGVAKSEKCEMCAKFVNMDLGYTTPVYWVSTMNKVHGFCSHVCKNLYILSSRKILSCTSCKVKKYNYDLVECFTNSTSAYAVCSIACLPKPDDYLRNVRSVLYLPQPTSDKTTPSAVSMSKSTVSAVRTATQYSTQRGQPLKNTAGTPVLVTSEASGVPVAAGGVQITESDNILDVLTIEEVKMIMEELRKRRPEMKNKICSAKPRTRTVETQTDVSELNEMRMIPLKALEQDGDKRRSFSDSTQIHKESSNLDESSQRYNSNGSNDIVKDQNTSKETNFKSRSDSVNLNLDIDSGELQTRINLTETITTTPLPPDSTPEPRLSEALHSSSDSTPNGNGATPIESSVPLPCTPTVAPSFFNPSVLNSPVGNNFATEPPLANPSLTTAPMLSYGGQDSPSPVGAGGSFVNVPTPTGLHPLSPSVSLQSPSSLPAPLGYGTHSHTLGYNRPPLPASANALPQHTAHTPKNRVESALRAWKMMFGQASDPRSTPAAELSFKLCDLVNRGCTPNGQKYRTDSLLYLSLGIQQLLSEVNRVDRIFYDNIYYNFVIALTNMAEREQSIEILATINESDFWETLELGATSPGVLLFTLIFLFRKHFGLKSWTLHSSLLFNNVVLQSRFDQSGKVVKYLSIVGMPGVYPIEVPENFYNPQQCIVKLFEFYCYKSATRSGPLYRCLRLDHTPRTPWFTLEPLSTQHIYQMLVRASMIKQMGSTR